MSIVRAEHEVLRAEPTITNNDANSSVADRKRLVMLLLNDCTHDTRVMKEATSLSNHGFEVHIVALMNPGLESVQDVNGITIHRITKRLFTFKLIPILGLLLPGISRIPKIKCQNLSAQQSKVAQCAFAIISAVLRCMTIMVPVLFCLILIPAWLMAKAMTVLSAIFARRHSKLDGMSAKFKRFAHESIQGLWNNKHEWLTKCVNNIAVFLPYSLRHHTINVDLATAALALQPDIVQAHDCNTLLGGAMVSRSSGARLVYDSHELYLERNIGSRSRWWDKFQWAPIERKCIRHCDVVLTVSKGIVNHLNTQYDRDDVVLVRNVQPYHPAPPRNSLLRDEFAIPADRSIALYIGAITFNRGVEELIKAAEGLEHSALVIMGPAIDPTYVDRLKAQATANGTLDRTIYFRGPVDSPQVLEYCASTDIGVVPTQACCLSYEFESSNKIFHCVMAGRPLAMSNHIEKRLLVEEYGIGRLFDETDPTDIARVIDEMAMDTAGMESMAAHCIEAAKSLCWEHDEIRLLNSVNHIEIA